MVNAQEWLDKNYKRSIRDEVKELRVSEQNLEDKAKNKLKENNEKEGQRLLWEILRDARKCAKEKTNWQDDWDLHEKIESLEEKGQLTGDEIRELCQAQTEEAKLEIRYEALVEQPSK